MQRYGRDIFLYMEPDVVDGDDDFAQCGSCRMFVGAEALKGEVAGRCILHGAKLKVDEDDTCGLYVRWPKGKRVARVVSDHAEEIERGIAASVTPAVSGFAEERVQCHRCAHFDAERSECGLYDSLNGLEPEQYAFDVKVKPHACCNAWQERDDEADEYVGEVTRRLGERDK